jgi:hypothetical protein
MCCKFENGLFIQNNHQRIIKWWLRILISTHVYDIFSVCSSKYIFDEMLFINRLLLNNNRYKVLAVSIPSCKMCLNQVLDQKKNVTTLTVR